MKKTFYRFLGSTMAAVMLAGTLGQFPVSAAVENGWEEVDGKRYWYENGVKQGTEGRGKEIYDPGSDAWYWLDAVDDGKMAVSKDVYQESQADDAGNMGKWVRYDAEGHMIKGWSTTEAGTYYFDLTYGTMAKGSKEIDGVSYFFNEGTGIMESGGTQDGWASIDGKDYWYENGVRQGYDPNDPSYRGKEIYDPGSDAWYWLDNVQQGAKAVSKDVYQESQADDAGNIGKWVRYDAEGHMIKGWHEQNGSRYYFDPTYGTMAKGDVVIDGKTYRFNRDTGICEGEQGGNTGDNPGNEPGGDTPGTEEPKYDFGGATVRLGGYGPWSDLEQEPDSFSYTRARDIADQIEEKYNIKFEYTKLKNEDGYPEVEVIMKSFTDGECFADIFTKGNEMMLPLKDYLVDITEFSDELKMGSIYLDAATWRGHTYGFTPYEMGRMGYLLAYSRDYLKSIGMDVTPTQKFLAGQWSYEDAKEYLTELKSKLPEGTYPIAVHSSHLAAMAPAANGTVSVDSDGGIHLADAAYTEALDFYKELLDLGLAAPVTSVEIDDESDSISVDMPYLLDGMSNATEGKGYVLASVEVWQMDGLESQLGGEWGIVPFPWGSNVNCDGDYTTLSDTYRTAVQKWGNMVVPKADYRAAGAKEVPDNVLFQIAKDYYDLYRPEGAAARTAMYEAEKAGQHYENLGFEPGRQGRFSTMEDVGLYDWLHSRAVLDWGYAVEGSYYGSIDCVKVYRNAAFVIAAGRDAKASGEKYKALGEAAMEEAGLLK